MAKTTGFPKKDAHSTPDQHSDDKFLIKFLSNRVSFMGNPVAVDFEVALLLLLPFFILIIVYIKGSFIPLR